MSKSYFGHLIEQAKKRLARWKIKILSKTARAVLISSTLTSLPVFTMLIIAIPKAIIAHLDCICREFFWGEGSGVRRLHSIAWNRLCQPKEARAWVSNS